MSQRDVLAELRTAHVSAPPELRERIRLVAAATDGAPPRKLVTWRRSLVLAVPVAAAVAAAVVLTRPSHHQAQRLEVHGAIATAPKAFGLPTTPKRAQRYSATLSLRVHDQTDLSNSVKQALRITTSLGGYASSTNVATGSAQLVLKVPRTKVVLAFARLAKLGTIVGERINVVDQQAAVNANLRTIARLQHELKALRAQPQTAAVKRQIAQLTARVEALQRANANTIRADRYATVSLNLSTPPHTAPVHHGHGPLHWIGVGFKWIGIGLLYALAFGVPLALIWLVVRVVRRRRIDSLLNS
ncbi:MAG TPA: DUF4349 domain-containing protein [Gaiellaceae bacterium]|nr:DUF4349 domain-containing protein [Gaiellaceae bacterium]